ncbi:MAG: hypothetical protein JO108_17000 [Acidobacteriaceae bacterium]|nr:hypothetical protein [Acidobacteriaceae bacterium]
MASKDPDFERKAADVIGLYLNFPQHAAVFCVDEVVQAELTLGVSMTHHDGQRQESDT